VLIQLPAYLKKGFFLFVEPMNRTVSQEQNVYISSKDHLKGFTFYQQWPADSPGDTLHQDAQGFSISVVTEH
jgi:hypothetical protein